MAGRPALADELRRRAAEGPAPPDAKPPPGADRGADSEGSAGGRTEDQPTATAGLRVGRFAWEKRLRGSTKVTGTELLVLMVLATYGNADGTSMRATQATIATDCGLSDRAVRRHLGAAVAAGWLEVVVRGHRRGDNVNVASEYAATVPQPERSDRFSDGSTGTDEPVDDDLNRNGATASHSQPDAQPDAQPEPGVHPPSHQVHQEEVAVVQSPTEDRVLQLLERRRDDWDEEMVRARRTLETRYGEEVVDRGIEHLIATGRLFTFPSQFKKKFFGVIQDLAIDRLVAGRDAPRCATCDGKGWIVNDDDLDAPAALACPTCQEAA